MDVETRDLFMKLFDIIERFEISFKTEIAGIKKEIAGLRVEVAELKVEVAGLKAEVAELKTEMAGLKNEQARTNERLDALSSLYGFHEVAIQRLKQKMIL